MIITSILVVVKFQKQIICSPESEENGTKYCRLIYLRNTAVCIEPYSSYEKAIGYTVF